MNRASILVVSLALFSLANIAHANYERTMDGKTKVWHNTPQRRVQASWSGDRDEKGYATGKGTLTWFKVQRNWLTGSLLPSTTKYAKVSQYTGKMVEGKLEGAVVSVDAKGNTYHAKFADGQRTGTWIAGSVHSSHKRADQESAPPKIAKTSAQAPSPAPTLTEEPASKQPEQAVPPVETQSPVPNGSAARPEDSLQALAKPPSSLRVGGASETPAQSSAPMVDVGEEVSSKSSPSSPPPAPARPENSMQNDDARSVAALDSEYQAAVKTNDAPTIDRILGDDFVLVHGAGQTLSKSDVLKQAREKHVKYEHNEIQPGSQKVRVWRDTAVVTETLWIKGSENGKPVDQKIPVTETYVRMSNGWRYVSGQASLPAQ
jgi:ketosteroid isomerase-like protein